MSKVHPAGVLFSDDGGSVCCNSSADCHCGTADHVQNWKGEGCLYVCTAIFNRYTFVLSFRNQDLGNASTENHINFLLRSENRRYDG